MEYCSLTKDIQQNKERKQKISYQPVCGLFSSKRVLGDAFVELVKSWKAKYLIKTD
jgi:hypothetical protein